MIRSAAAPRAQSGAIVGGVLAWMTAVVFFGLIVAAANPLAAYMDAVFTGARTPLSTVFAPAEHTIYRLCGIDPAREMTWQEYARAAVAVTLAGTAALYALLRTQAWLPLNPQHFGNVTPEIAWNTAISFATTTDWQFYSGENTMSYLSQMTGLAWQNFIAGAVGCAAGVAVIRGFAREGSNTLGNFWADLVRSVLYVLLPLAVLTTIALVATGVPQNLRAYVGVVNGDHVRQLITGGPMASQEAISLLGGNGGGFVGANTASPNLNPDAVSNVIELFAVWLVPAAFPLLFGRMTRNPRAGAALLAAMIVLAALGFAGAQLAEAHNLEGKEVRFGTAGAGLSLTVASNSGTGAANATYDSLTPLGGAVALVNMELGEVAFGGVGSGLYGLLVYAVLTVFICGLLVGRTPEYLGKKIERREVQFAMIATLVFPALVLTATAVAAAVPAGTAVLGATGPHGFSEILYAFTSVAANNGSAMAGLGPNLFYETATALVMLGGRFLVMIPTLALAGTIAQRPTNRLREGLFRTDDAMFVALLVAVTLLVGALTFLPADAFGPLADHVTWRAGQLR
jgi:K+-transporting ATPase ATPase A chain